MHFRSRPSLNLCRPNLSVRRRVSSTVLQSSNVNVKLCLKLCLHVWLNKIVVITTRLKCNSNGMVLSGQKVFSKNGFPHGLGNVNVTCIANVTDTKSSKQESKGNKRIFTVTLLLNLPLNFCSSSSVTYSSFFQFFKKILRRQRLK